MTEEWLNAMHKGELTGVLMIDLCKAFDLVDHSLLLRKLNNYRCSEDALTWFTSSLSERTQRVDINGKISNPLDNKFGVPQGLILGALFVISLYAHDATAHHSSKCTQIITQKLQNVATSANKWCENNKIKLSIIKTKVALVGSKQRVNRLTDSDKQIKIIINDIPIE